MEGSPCTVKQVDVIHLKQPISGVRLSEVDVGIAANQNITIERVVLNPVGQFIKLQGFKAYLWYDDSDEDLRLQNYNELNGGDLSLNPYGGNVGIGTSTPRERLEVDGGNIRIQGVDGYDAPGESAYLHLGSTPNYIKATRNFGMNLGVFGVPDVVTIRHNTGYVGIGTTNPATALDVVGTVTADAFDGPISASQLIGTVASDNIAPGAITSPLLADGAVTTTHILNGTVKGEDIANRTIDGDKLMSSSIISTHIQDNSVWSFDMVDEPGMKTSYKSSQVVGTTLVTLESVTMTPPNSGFVVVLATGWGKTVKDGISVQVLEFGISTSNTAFQGQSGRWRGISDGLHRNSLTAHRVYPVSLGVPITFYFLASKLAGDNPITVDHANITAMYFPTRY